MNLQPPPTLARLRAKRAEILMLAKRYGAKDIRIFGSVARGEATSTSDVDFLVTWDYSQIPSSSWGGIGFEIELEKLIEYPVDVVSSKWLNPQLRDSVLAEAIDL